MISKAPLLAGAVLMALAPWAAARDPERWEEPRRLPPPRVDARGLEVRPKAASAADLELGRLAESLAGALLRQYGEAVEDAAAPPADCRGPVAVAAHQRALRALGRNADCMQWVGACERQLPPGGRGLEQVLSEAARCASADFQYARAHEWHDRATRPENAASEVYPGMVYVFARFAFLTEYQAEVPAILGRNPAWAGAKLPVVQGSIEYLANGDTTLAPAAAIGSEVTQWIAGGDPVLRQLAAVDWAWDLLWNRYQERDSARFLAARGEALTSPQEWWPIAFAAVYRAVEDGDFAPARRIYDATLPFLHPDSPLPVANNPYTYSELYDGACRTGLSAGAALDEQRSLQGDWLAGRLAAAQARERAQRLQSSGGERADVLTLLGGLAEDLGRDDEARDWYWRAHRACPYYNRAHDGLANIRARRRARASSDREAILARVDRETRAAPLTPDVRHFVANWAALPDRTRQGLLHGLRLWAPYLDGLAEQGTRIYLTRAPERISDLEPFRGQRDRRYSDNRLYDDIGGLANDGFAGIDLTQAIEGPLLGGDITAHEVTHLFHSRLPAAPRACVATLFARAAKRGVFPDPYAGLNEFEYLAVGVEVFLTPADALPRFGPNLGWLRRNDPDLVSFLEGIAEGREPAALACPVR